MTKLFIQIASFSRNLDNICAEIWLLKIIIKRYKILAKKINCLKISRWNKSERREYDIARAYSAMMRAKINVKTSREGPAFSGRGGDLEPLLKSESDLLDENEVAWPASDRIIASIA